MVDRSRRLRLSLAVVLAALVALTGAGAASAHVAPPRPFPIPAGPPSAAQLMLQREAPGIVGRLQRALGAGYAGVWMNPVQARFKVGVAPATDRGAARDALRGLGVAGSSDLVPVRSTWDELVASKERWVKRVIGDLLSAGRARIGIDTARNALALAVSDRIGPARAAAIRRAAARDAVNVAVEVRPLPSVVADGRRGRRARGGRARLSRRQLAREIMALARANGEPHPRNLRAVRSTHHAALRLFGDVPSGEDFAVYVVAAAGHFTGYAASHPPGEPPPKGRALTMIVRASDGLTTDWGLSPRQVRLSRIGDPFSLTPAARRVARTRGAIRALRSARRAVGHGHPYTLHPTYYRGRRVWVVDVARGQRRGGAREIYVSIGGNRILRRRRAHSGEDAAKLRRAKVPLARALRRAARAVHQGSLVKAQIDRSNGRVVFNVAFRQSLGGELGAIVDAGSGAVTSLWGASPTVRARPG